MLVLKKKHFEHLTNLHNHGGKSNLGNNFLDPPKPLPFDTEAELIKHIELEFFNQWKSANSSLIREFDCSNGIADLVVFRLKKNFKNHMSIGEIPPRWVYALYYLPYRRIFTTDELAIELGVSKATTSLAIKKYISLGYCIAGSKKQTWIKVKQPQLLTTKIFAVEAKLSKWRLALTQAIRYLDYANQSWVVLDSSCANAALSNIEQFQRYNIGLATIDTSGKFQVQYKPSSCLAKSDYKLWYANAEIARILKLSSNFDNNG